MTNAQQQRRLWAQCEHTARMLVQPLRCFECAPPSVPGLRLLAYVSFERRRD